MVSELFLGGTSLQSALRGAHGPPRRPKFDFRSRRRIVPPESAGQSLLAVIRGWRKVRAPADQVPGNAWGARAHGKCNREQTA